MEQEGTSDGLIKLEEHYSQRTKAKRIKLEWHEIWMKMCACVCVCEPSPIAIDPQREHRRPIDMSVRTRSRAGKDAKWKAINEATKQPPRRSIGLDTWQAGRRWYEDRESTVRSHLEWKYSTCRQRASTTAGWRTNTHTHSVRGFGIGGKSFIVFPAVACRTNLFRGLCLHVRARVCLCVFVCMRICAHALSRALISSTRNAQPQELVGLNDYPFFVGCNCSWCSCRLCLHSTIFFSPISSLGLSFGSRYSMFQCSWQRAHYPWQLIVWWCPVRLLCVVRVKSNWMGMRAEKQDNLCKA